MKILVTGASGQLGRVIVTQLRSRKDEVLGIDITKSATTDEIIDIRNKDAVDKILAGIDAIIHTAALHGKHHELNYPRKAFVETNINGTLNLLDGAVKNGVKKFLYTSTTSIYGTAMVGDKQAVWIDEHLTPEPRDIYDITKLTCELLCKDYFEKEDLETVVLRVSRFFPESENEKVNYRLYRGLDEEDGAMAHLLALEKNFQSFEVFNISNKSPFKKTDLLELYHHPKDTILKYHPKAEAIYQKNGWNFPESIDRVYAIDKAIKILNYQPKNNFESLLI